MVIAALAVQMLAARLGWEHVESTRKLYYVHYGPLQCRHVHILLGPEVGVHVVFQVVAD